mmetsp:Transcript_48162/g.98374  ORF Transcript_48162/g.98374 Transcript_48162/m.98374 type:complete len:295 (+) Transcript_48162:765-1649(+)
MLVVARCRGCCVAAREAEALADPGAAGLVEEGDEREEGCEKVQPHQHPLQAVATCAVDDVSLDFLLHLRCLLHQPIEEGERLGEEGEELEVADERVHVRRGDGEEEERAQCHHDRHRQLLEGSREDEEEKTGEHELAAHLCQLVPPVPHLVRFKQKADGAQGGILLLAALPVPRHHRHAHEPRAHHLPPEPCQPLQLLSARRRPWQLAPELLPLRLCALRVGHLLPHARLRLALQRPFRLQHPLRCTLPALQHQQRTHLPSVRHPRHGPCPALHAAPPHPVFSCGIREHIPRAG